MAVKKTELYSSLWASCDALRGGMDASQYKDYILTLLFMKYVTDKYKGQKYGDLTVFDKEHDPNPDPEKRTGCSFDDFIALKNKKNIGEGIDKIIARLAEVNDSLKGVIDIAHFNDEAKIGKGQEMVDKLTKLIAIFQRPELDFSNNKADGDDIIGDAYEYLMRNFATESGKSKGQFYTPAEVSRILAKVIGIDKCTDHDATVCDPACGSGSLLIRALAEVPFEISGYGQEKESSTAGLAKMNAVLHNKATIKIMAGNTFSDPQFIKKVKYTKAQLNSFFGGSFQYRFLERYPSGRVKSILINQKQYSGREVREKLQLSSSDFEIVKEGNSYIFVTKGCGHGVGLSQYGAQGMAKEGYNYQAILKHYYQGVEISKNKE